MEQNNLRKRVKTYNKNRSYIVRSNCIGTETLHNDLKSAILSKHFIDETGCSGICKRDHEIINLEGLGSAPRKASIPCSDGLPFNSLYLSKETHYKEMQNDCRT
jgi:hypothetical protein